MPAKGRAGDSDKLYSLSGEKDETSAGRFQRKHGGGTTYRLLMEPAGASFVLGGDGAASWEIFLSMGSGSRKQKVLEWKKE